MPQIANEDVVARQALPRFDIRARRKRPALVTAFNNVLQERTRDTGAPAYAMIVAGTLAFAVFTLPLLGMRARLRAEKTHMPSKTDHAIKTALANIHDRVTLQFGGGSDARRSHPPNDIGPQATRPPARCGFGQLVASGHRCP